MIGLLACLYALGVTAQERKLRVHVQNEDYYEMDSAKVTVIGTGKSYYTDKHGYVMINDMPLVLDSLEVTKGRRYGKVSPTIQVKMFPEVMKPFSWFVKAGFGCFVPGMELEEFSPEFFIGGGADIRLSRMMAFQPAIHFVYRKGSCYDYDSWYDDETGDYIYADKSTYEIGTLEIPLLLSWKLPLISMQTFNSSLVRILTWDCGETLPERDIMDIIRRILLMTIMKWKVLKNFSEVGSPEEVPLVSG